MNCSQDQVAGKGSTLAGERKDEDVQLKAGRCNSDDIIYLLASGHWGFNP